ncbi:MAG TPA: DUF899 domain-containing protein [Bryobacteraceae bacterium]|nr:DUF899 domain-containing protein [Bryobacteraceae bacterium]
MSNSSAPDLRNHRVVSREEWLAARTAFLAKEKEFTQQRDELNRQRRDLPWEAVTEDYSFEGPAGKQSLAALFDGRSQLIVYHFMFEPEWDAGCKHCSFWADNFNSIVVHVNHRDTTLIAVSRAPYAKLAAYKKRMGWTFQWFSSFGSDFNYDFGVSFTPEQLARKKAFYNYTEQNPGHAEREGASVFFKDATGTVFHTYSTYARGIDILNTAYHYIDLTPKGRDEGDTPQRWVRRRDEYDK